MRLYAFETDKAVIIVVAENWAAAQMAAKKLRPTLPHLAISLIANLPIDEESAIVIEQSKFVFTTFGPM